MGWLQYVAGNMNPQRARVFTNSRFEMLRMPQYRRNTTQWITAKFLYNTKLNLYILTTVNETQFVFGTDVSYVARGVQRLTVGHQNSRFGS